MSNTRIEFIRSAIAEGRTYKSIGGDLGVSGERIRQLAKAHNLGGGFAAAHECHHQIAHMVKEGASVRSIAFHFGLSETWVKKLARDYGVGLAAQAKERRDEELRPYVDLVKSGASIHSVAKGDRVLEARIWRACRDAGVSILRGRWRDRSERISIIVNGLASGHTYEQMAQDVSAVEGYRVSAKSLYGYALRHGLNKYRIPRVKQPKQPRPPRPPRLPREAPAHGSVSLRGHRHDDELRAKVKSLKGIHSAAKIASMFHLVSRNAVIGIWNRP